MMRIVVAAFAAVLALDGCGRIPESSVSAEPAAVARSTDPDVALLEHYHWTPQGAPKVVSLTISQPDTWSSAGGPPFNVYLDASRAIGFDFTPWAGQTLELRTYMLGRTVKQQRQIYGHLLGDQQRVVGAWLSVDAEAPGIYPLNRSLEDLVYLAPGYRTVELV